MEPSASTSTLTEKSVVWYRKTSQTTSRYVSSARNRTSEYIPDRQRIEEKSPPLPLSLRIQLRYRLIEHCGTGPFGYVRQMCRSYARTIPALKKASHVRRYSFLRRDSSHFILSLNRFGVTTSEEAPALLPRILGSAISVRASYRLC